MSNIISGTDSLLFFFFLCLRKRLQIDSIKDVILYQVVQKWKIVEIFLNKYIESISYFSGKTRITVRHNSLNIVVSRVISFCRNFFFFYIFRVSSHDATVSAQEADYFRVSDIGVTIYTYPVAVNFYLYRLTHPCLHAFPYLTRRQSINEATPRHAMPCRSRKSRKKRSEV